MDDSQRQSVGAVIRTLREAMGLTRQELSEASSARPDERVSVEMIAKVEQGRKAPSAKTLRKLAAGLGIEPLALSSSAARWEAAASAGARMWDLRAALIGGSLAARAAAPFAVTAGLAPIMPFALTAGFAVHKVSEQAEVRRHFEALRTALRELGSPEDVQDALAKLENVVLPEAPTDV